MRKVLLLVILFCETFGYSQTQGWDTNNSNSNVFSQNDIQNQQAAENNYLYDCNNDGIKDSYVECDDDGGPGNPGDLPINSNLYILIVIGIGIIVYVSTRKKTIVK